MDRGLEMALQRIEYIRRVQSAVVLCETLKMFARTSALSGPYLRPRTVEQCSGTLDSSPR